jgi:hypothetical protein
MRSSAMRISVFARLAAALETVRESCRVKMALLAGRLATLKTFESFEFAFQPSIYRNRILSLAQLQICRALSAKAEDHWMDLSLPTSCMVILTRPCSRNKPVQFFRVLRSDFAINCKPIWTRVSPYRPLP